MPTLLLTGARAPATLDLARQFHAAGWRVCVADSNRYPVSRFSQTVTRFFHTPPPNGDLSTYGQALSDIIRVAQVDLLIPTCEEIFFVAQRLDDLRHQTTVFCAPFEQLDQLHNKWLFNQQARRHGLTVPQSWLISSRDDLVTRFEQQPNLVLKPAYSRFGNQTLLRPTRADITALAIRQAWVAQEFVEGTELCTYSIAHQGRLTAHAAYRESYRVGQANIVFEATPHPAAEAWVRTFVEAEQFTGQIGFDFIEDASGQVFAIECNPRTTNGVYLFRHQADLPTAFVEPTRICLTPQPQPPIQVSLGMWLYVLPSLRSAAALRQWWQMYRRSEDAVYTPADPLPAWGQWLSYAEFWWRSSRHGLSMMDATTLDMAWNGREESSV